MENYNLTAELKKIASGITSSDPNTELGNINSGVGNLDTAMQGVATAINGISIPNPGSNIDGVATAITNKVIPDPNTQLANIVSAINNKNIPDPNTELGNITNAITSLGMLLGAKFYYDQHTFNTSGTWGNYTSYETIFDLPRQAYGPGKTFMLLHHIRISGTYNSNIESYIELINGGSIFINRYYDRSNSNSWFAANHIAFIISDTSPWFRFNVATSTPINNIWSQYVLVPLN